MTNDTTLRARRGANRSRPVSSTTMRKEFAAIASRAFDIGFNDAIRYPLVRSRGRPCIRHYLDAMRAHVERCERQYVKAQRLAVERRGASLSRRTKPQPRSAPTG